MDGGFTILVCLFASMGLVQAFGWLRCCLAKPKTLPDAYTVIPLCTRPAELEQQIRYELACRRWNTAGQHSYLVLVDNGLDSECREICGRLLEGTYGVFICTPGTLGETLNAFSHLQAGEQGI